ncbi:hypothetical protein BDY21DRAFT_10568 [Lineolata rhizophorae]|uniref:SET domain-containing protein n=1 Tax=Lineolata rhizophorae TaxID=578093 RepID=A0A6A6PE58_9PEZI|nr:hypothetical protein BDY21DRAFT_10568 [Lineolata rhizophorae]
MSSLSSYPRLPSSALKPWADLNGVIFDGVAISKIPGKEERGSAVLATRSLIAEEATPLMVVPRTLALTREAVAEYAKADSILRSVLDAVGETVQTSRGAILAFLLLQSIVARPNAPRHCGVKTPFTEYIQFLSVPSLPTFYPVSLYPLMYGTTLLPVLRGKLATLQREFETIASATADMSWRKALRELDDAANAMAAIATSPTSPSDEDAEVAIRAALGGRGLGEESEDEDDEMQTDEAILSQALPGQQKRKKVAPERPPPQHPTHDISFDDWKILDAMYRSRALEYPGLGDAVVPCIDMANHSSGSSTVAAYEVSRSSPSSDEPDAVLLLRPGKVLDPGDEVTITYGDRKGACEMLFSYGFLEDSMRSARELFLEIDVPADDPLGPAKRAIFPDAPFVRVFDREESGGAGAGAGPAEGSAAEDRSTTGWESPFVWLVAANEEDGLDFAVLSTVTGERELQATFRGEPLASAVVGAGAKDSGNSTGRDPAERLKSLLEADDALRDVFRLRAAELVYQRVVQQLEMLVIPTEEVEEGWDEEEVRMEAGREAVEVVKRLRGLEGDLLKRARRDLEKEVSSSSNFFFCPLLFEIMSSCLLAFAVLPARSFISALIAYSRHVHCVAIVISVYLLLFIARILPCRPCSISLSHPASQYEHLGSLAPKRLGRLLHQSFLVSEIL